LAQHQQIQSKLLEEIQRVIGNDPPAYKHLQSLQYTEQVLREAMRLKPVVPVIIRRSVAADTVCGKHIPADSSLMIRTFPDPQGQFFKQPAQFNPDNYLTDVVDKRDKGSSMPFGAGIRQCPGFSFAMVEMKLLLALIVRDYKLELTHNGYTLDTLPTNYRMVVAPTVSVWIHMAPRSSAS